MDLSYLQNPGFWVAQFVITVLFMFTRFPSEFVRWRVERAVRRALTALDECVSQDDEEFDEEWLRRVKELECDYREAPRLLRPFYALRVIREAKRARTRTEHRANHPTSGSPDTQAAQTVAAEHEHNPGEQHTTATASSSSTATSPDPVIPRESAAARVDPGTADPDKGDAEPSPVEPMRPEAASRPTRTRTATLVGALCLRLTAYAARIVGGDFGLEYLTEMAGDLADVRKPLVELFYALSNLVGAVRLRLILRTVPFLQELFTSPTDLRPRRVLVVIDRIVDSSVASGAITVLTDTVLLLGTEAWLGRTIADWAALPLIAVSCYGLGRLRTGWRHLRREQQRDGT